MPILQNAKKALRQNTKRAARNKIISDEIHSLRRAFRKAADGKDAKKAAEIAKSLQQKLDKAIKVNILKKNTGIRLKSRMMNKLNAIGK